MTTVLSAVPAYADRPPNPFRGSSFLEVLGGVLLFVVAMAALYGFFWLVGKIKRKWVRALLLLYIVFMVLGYAKHNDNLRMVAAILFVVFLIGLIKEFS